MTPFSFPNLMFQQQNYGPRAKDVRSHDMRNIKYQHSHITLQGEINMHRREIQILYLRECGKFCTVLSFIS